jgi:hypothetical protein
MEETETEESKAQRDLLLAARAALRGLVATYVDLDAGRIGTFRAHEAETIYLLLLHLALQQSSDLTHTFAWDLPLWRALSSRGDEPYELIRLLRDALGDGAMELDTFTERITDRVATRLARVDVELAGQALRATDLDRQRLAEGSFASLAASPLWSNEPLRDSDSFETASMRVASLVQRGPQGRERWQAWYGDAMRGEPELIEALSTIDPSRLDQPFSLASSSERGMLLVGESVASKPLSASTRVVNTGFADLRELSLPLPSNVPLRHASEVAFWLEIGELIAASIETTPTRLDPELVEAGAVLTVVVFGYGDGLRIESQSTGLLRVGVDEAVVVRQPASSLDHPAALAQRRLFFPLRMPATGQSARLRCSLYYRQVLIQSRLVEIALGDGTESVERALRSTLDYNLSDTLAPRALEQFGEHRLSVMLNDAPGSHQFRFFGKDAEELVADASFSEGELSDLLKQGRRALRTASWGAPDEWKQHRYKYDGRPSNAQLGQDLIALAVSGFRFYDAIIKRLSGDRAPQQLQELMKSPGRVQLSARRSAREVIPSALLYDRTLDTGAKLIEICPAFLEDLANKARLEASVCFQGACPTLGNDTVVCPSGFWGFRHDIGLPVSLAQDGRDTEAPTSIAVDGAPSIAVCVSTDPRFVHRVPHQQRLATLFNPTSFRLAASRDEVKTLLRQSSADVIYFYCHGGRKGKVPFLLVGHGENGITRDNFRPFKWDWSAHRPLVFLNGCHTTELTPAQALDLVTGFTETARAAGVIGTEVTVFEPLATRFAEAFFDHFVTGREELGRAIRLARLVLLGEGNPLGLVYIPFAVSSLKLQPS